MKKANVDYKEGNAKIFTNPVLEKLTQTSPLQNITVYGLTIALLMYLGLSKTTLPTYWVVGLFLLGILVWTFAEYMLHRYVFHWVTDSSWSQRVHFIMHGAHHHFPKDEERLLMPPVPGLIMASILFLVFYVFFWLFGISNLTFGFFAGFFSGYLMYSFVHRAIHMQRPPKGFKHLWFHHNLHHYRYPDKAFGVSNTFWDRVFGTMPPVNSKKSSIH